MDLEATMTSKGQITVPLKIRKELGVKAGDKIVFGKNDDDEITVRPARKDSPFAKYRGIERKGVGLDRKAIIDDLREIRDGGNAS